MAVKKTKPAEKPAAEEMQVSVYLGPNIRGIITKGQIFPCAKDEAMSTLPPAAADYPGIAGLIVSAEELPEARKQVFTPGTLLNKRFNTLAKRQK